MPVAPKELQASIPPFGLRMHPELKDRVKSAAEANNRSMNAEITTVLEDCFMSREKPAASNFLWRHQQRSSSRLFATFSRMKG